MTYLEQRGADLLLDPKTGKPGLLNTGYEIHLPISLSSVNLRGINPHRTRK